MATSLGTDEAKISGAISIVMSSVNIALPKGTNRRPSVKLVVDGQTWKKQDFLDDNINWKLDPPYIFSNGPSLAIQLRERRNIGSSQLKYEWSVPFGDAKDAASRLPGQALSYELCDNPRVTLIVSLSAEESHIASLRVAGDFLRKRDSVLDGLGKSRAIFETILKFGTAVSEVNPIAKAVLASINVVYQILEAQEKRDELVLELVDDMTRTICYVGDVDQFARLVQLIEAIKEVKELAKETEVFITQYSNLTRLENTFSSTVSSSTSQQIKDLKGRFERFKQQFDRGVAIQSAAALQSLLKDLASTEDEAILATLKPRGVGGDSLPTECMNGTRQDILRRIEEWTMDLSAPNVLWIKGHPGVGKSTLASSVVTRLRGEKRLGSRFFFERAKSDALTPSALWRMVAFDLSRSYPTVRKDLLAKLDNDGDLPTTGNLDDLFRLLIQEPLMASDSIPVGRLPVIVIDALDECGGLEGPKSRYRKHILRTLSKWPTLPRKLKIIITSRDEIDIGRVLKDIGTTIEIPTGADVTPQSASDIGTFLEMRFREIREQYTSLIDWPGHQVTQQLVDDAEGLFIWAKVVTDFVEDGEPRKRLELVKEGTGGRKGMAGLYSQILEISFPDPTDEEFKALHSVLGVTILVQQPTSAESVAIILKVEISSVQHICNKLNSVVESRKALRIRHQSFTDFLIDKTTCPAPFYINRQNEERMLALACLQVMKSNLCFNICKIESSYLLNSEVPDIEARVEQYISSQLQYACRYWVHHLASTEYCDEIMESTRHFADNQFLFWLEVLSFTKRVTTASVMVSSLIDYMKKFQKQDLMVSDMQRFITTFASIISQSVPHIYLSALPFAPRDTTISKRYIHQYPGCLRSEHGGLQDWPIFQNIIHAHSALISSVAFSPDGRSIASGSYDKTVRIWDTRTGELTAGPFEGHDKWIRSVAFSPDGKLIASASDDKTIRICNSQTTDLVASPFEGHKEGVLTIAFSRNGQLIVSGSSDSTIRIWDVLTGNMVVGPFEGHAGWIFSVAFSPDGRSVVSGSEDGTVRVWDAQTGESMMGPFGVSLMPVYSVAFSPDGQLIASGSEDNTVRMWNIRTGDALTKEFKGHSREVNSVAFSANGGHMVSGSGDKTIRLWDTQTGESVAVPLEGHTMEVYSVAFSLDGKLVASGSGDGTIRIWEAWTSESPTNSFEGHSGEINSVAFSPDDRFIASGSDDNTIRIWDILSGEPVLGALEGHTDRVWSVAFSSDGRFLASGSSDTTVRIWDLQTHGSVGRPSEGHSKRVTSVAFSPDGGSIVSGSDDKTIRIWDARTGDVVEGPIQGHTREVSSVAFSPNGELIISGSEDGTVRIRNLRTGESAERLYVGPQNYVNALAISPDGQSIATGSSDGMINMWDVVTGNSTAGPFKWHTDIVYSVAFSSDGLYIASGSEDDTIMIWNARTGDLVTGSLEGHSGAVRSVAFSPNGRFLVSGSEDKTIRIWNTNLYEGVSSIGSFRMEEGWVLTSRFNRLFWVPPILRVGLMGPSTRAIIGNIVATRLNLNAFKHGESWIKCRGSTPSDV